jgi:S-adenosylmethionine uptake transporter
VLLFDDPITWMAVSGMVLIVSAGLGATLLRSRSAVPDSTLPSTET